MVEGWDVTPNVLGAESNECFTFIGNYELNISDEMNDHDKWLVSEGYRLPTGALHQCQCALQGRAHIINGTTHDVYDWDAMVKEHGWPANYTAACAVAVHEQTQSAHSVFSEDEAAVYNMGTIFGIHNGM